MIDIFELFTSLVSNSFSYFRKLSCLLKNLFTTRHTKLLIFYAVAAVGSIPTVGCIEHPNSFLPKIKNQAFMIQLLREGSNLALVLDPRFCGDG
jgi:hypothetical protein